MKQTLAEMKKALSNQGFFLGFGRSDMIRTCDPCVPNAVLYRAELHSEHSMAAFNREGR